MLKTNNHPVHLCSMLGKKLWAELPPKTATLGVGSIGSQLRAFRFFECYENVHEFRLHVSDALYRWSGSFTAPHVSGDNTVSVTKHSREDFL